MHVAVAGHLGDHRCGGDRGAARVAVDHRPVLDRAARHREAVDQAGRAGHRDPLEAAARARPGWSRAGRGSRSRGRSAPSPPPAPRRARTQRVELLALLGRAHLRVVELAESARRSRRLSALVVDQHRRGDQRPGERAAPGLVGAGDEAGAELAVEPEQPRGRRRRRARRVAALTAGPASETAVLARATVAAIMTDGSALQQPIRSGGQ